MPKHPTTRHSRGRRLNGKLSVLRALSDPGDDENPFLIGFLMRGDRRLRLYVRRPDSTGIIGADIHLTDTLTALIASLPSLIEEEERHRPAPDDPHCDLLVDLTAWRETPERACTAPGRTCVFDGQYA
ncbi:hypothetical protein [Streptomyces adelaidensis]|uniref:hypothetical protein n=1 Tax=Streptomyces adelaidensis TaxID=2796465 RepID=UPI001905C0CE|nr:hypothetical protein [Streptomyces adelaidensis]